MLNKTDEQLMLLIQNEDERAFGILVKRYLPKALSYAQRLIGTDPEDLVQETFVKAWKNAYKFNSEKALFTTWFFTILKNECYSYLKKHKNIRLDNIDDVPDLQSDTKSAIDNIIDLENNKELNDTINNLNQREKEVILLRYFKELSNKETAKIMNSSIKAIETLLNRAKKKLKRELT